MVNNIKKNICFESFSSKEYSHDSYPDDEDTCELLRKYIDMGILSMKGENYRSLYTHIFSIPKSERDLIQQLCNDCDSILEDLDRLNIYTDTELYFERLWELNHRINTLYSTIKPVYVSDFYTTKKGDVIYYGPEANNNNNSDHIRIVGRDHNEVSPALIKELLGICDLSYGSKIHNEKFIVYHMSNPTNAPIEKKRSAAELRQEYLYMFNKKLKTTRSMIYDNCDIWQIKSNFKTRAEKQEYPIIKWENQEIKVVERSKPEMHYMANMFNIIEWDCKESAKSKNIAVLKAFMKCALSEREDLIELARIIFLKEYYSVKIAKYPVFSKRIQPTQAQEKILRKWEECEIREKILRELINEMISERLMKEFSVGIDEQNNIMMIMSEILELLVLFYKKRIHLKKLENIRKKLTNETELRELENVYSELEAEYDEKLKKQAQYTVKCEIMYMVQNIC